jgi:hypothetical protein
MSSEPFSFDLSARRRLVPDHVLLQALQEFIRSHRSPGRCMFSAWNAWPLRPCTGEAVRKRYGSWSAALRLAGLPWPRLRRYTPEELVLRLEHAWRTLGYPPGPRALQRSVGVCVHCYNGHWGSLAEARKALHLFHRGLITRDQLLQKRRSGQRQPIPPAMRYDVMKRDGFRCVACGADPKNDPKVKLHVDHIHPVAADGKTTPENLQTLCSKCNQGKSDSV